VAHGLEDGGGGETSGLAEGRSLDGDGDTSVRGIVATGVGAGVPVAAATAPVGTELTTKADRPIVAAVSRATKRTASGEVDRSMGSIVWPETVGGSGLRRDHATPPSPAGASGRQIERCP
jgi:hypothetical protein